MATAFSDIYARAVFRFADYDFLSDDAQAREDVLEKYLLSTKAEFQHYCRKNLKDIDLENKQFNEDLDDDEIEILSLGIAFNWLSFKTLNSKLMKNVLNSRDYYYYSPGNLLDKIETLRKTIQQEYRSRIREYTYIDNALDEFKP